MKIQKAPVYATIYAAIVFLLTLYIIPLYTGGDQIHYRDFYKSCFYDQHDIWRQFICFQKTLSSSEPGYFIISKIANQLFMSKDLYIAFANAILTFSLVILIFKHYLIVWHRHIFLVLVLTNYYFIVMLFSAERLKFGFIFLFLALIFSNIKRNILFALSILTHAQMAIMLSPYFLAKIFSKQTNFSIKSITAIGGVLLFCGMFYFLQDHILLKFIAYSSSNSYNFGIFGALKTSIFIILAAISIRSLVVIVSGIPMVVLAYFLGSERIGMLAFILYAGFVVYHKGKMDLLLLIVMLYFSYKSFEFIYNILTYGSGFYFIE